MVVSYTVFAPHSSISVLGQEPTKTNNTSVPQLKDASLKVEKVLSDLNLPTNIAFINNKDFLILEKNGTVRASIDGNVLDKPVLKVNVSKGFFQGMLGIAIGQPNKNINATAITNSSNPLYVFLFYTEDRVNGDTPIGNRLYRYELINNELINPKLLLDLPAIPDSYGNGGAITIGSDDHIYVTIGSASTDNYYPHTMTLNYRNSTVVDGRGGILRISQDGNPVGDGILGNKYPLNLYYEYGIENSYGIDFDPVANNLWDVENDGSLNDEVNLVKPGFNSGFGMITGLSKENPAAPSALVNFSGKGIYSDPEFVWVKKPVATGLKFLKSDKLGKQYQNDLFIGGYLDGRIYHFKLNEDRTQLALPKTIGSRSLPSSDLPKADSIIFGEGFGGISNLVVGPDGYLYVVSIGTGNIYRIELANTSQASSNDAPASS